MNENMDPRFLEISDVRLQRGQFQLRVDRLRLRSGGLYSLKGANGAGKSTLLEVLALLEPPDSGTLLYQGQPVTYTARYLKKLRREVTLMQQNPLLFSGTVSQNLAFGLKLRNIPARQRQRLITDALVTTGLLEFAERPVKELSGGESRRVALARALVLQPRLLLLDEPTANLDVNQVAALERFLVNLPEQGITVVIATHDSGQPERLGGEVIHLEEGTVQQPLEISEVSGYRPLRQALSL